MFLCICQNSFLSRIVVTSPCFRLGQFLCTYHHSDIKMYSAILVIFHIPHRPLSEKIVMFSHRWCFPKAISSFPLVAICVFNSCWLSKTSACSACWDMTSFIKTPQKTTTTNSFFPSFFFLLNTVLNIEFLLHFAKGIWLGHSATLIAEISANFAFLQHVLFISGYAKTMSWHQGKYILPRPGKKRMVVDSNWYPLFRDIKCVHI